MADTLLEVTGVVSILAIMFFICVFTDALSLLGLVAHCRLGCKFGIYCNKKDCNIEPEQEVCNLEPEQKACQFIHWGDDGLSLLEWFRLLLSGRGQRPICKACNRFTDCCRCEEKIVSRIQHEGEKARDQWAVNLAREAIKFRKLWEEKHTQRGAANRAAASRSRSAGKQGKGH